MDLENCIFLIKALTMVNLLMEKQKDSVDFRILMEIYTLDNGEMIKHMVMANMFLEMEVCMTVTGLMIKDQVKEKSHGRMVLHFRAIMYEIKKMDMVCLNGQMEISIEDNLKTTKNVGKVS